MLGTVKKNSQRTNTCSKFLYSVETTLHKNFDAPQLNVLAHRLVSGISSLGITLLALFVGACTLVGLLWVYGKK